MQLISLRLRYAQKSRSGGKRIVLCEGSRGGPLAVGVTRVVTTAVARGDTRIVSLVSHQMMHSGENRSAVGHVSACSGLCSSCSSILPWQEVQQEKQLLSKGC